MTIKETVDFLESQNKDGRFDEAIAELKLGIPMKVNVREWIYTNCPHCSYELSKHHGDGYYSIPKEHERCPYCYQKLSWK